MAAISNLGVLSDAQAITAPAASTNHIDMVAVRNQIGAGKPVYLCIRTSVAPTQPADTLSIEFRHDDAAAMATPTVLFMPLCGAAGAEILASDARLATAGAWIYRATIPHECTQRHVDLYYNNTTSTGTFTIDAWLDTDPQSDWGGDKGGQILESPVGNP